MSFRYSPLFLEERMEQHYVAVRTFEKEEADVLNSLLPQWLVSAEWSWIFASVPIPEFVKSLKSVNRLL